jgi:hypothetical protein
MFLDLFGDTLRRFFLRIAEKAVLAQDMLEHAGSPGANSLPADLSDACCTISVPWVV